MPFDDLTQFLQSASDAGELERIGVELNPAEEISAVTQEICKEFRDQSPVIFCEHPGRYHLPVVTNLLGNRERFLRATGCEDLDQVLVRFQQALNPFPAVSRDWKFTPAAIGYDRSRIMSRNIRRGACQQVVRLGRDLDLSELPVLRSWSGESHAAITSGLVITDGGDGKSTVELVPAGIIDRETLVLFWRPTHVGYSQWQRAQAENRPFPIAIALGGDPLLTYVASLPLPQMLDPWVVAGILRNESVNLIRARSVELNVPADAEIVLEGYLDASAGAVSGTLAGPAGLLIQQNQLPVMRLTAMTHRANPLFPARVNAFDFQEDQVTSRLTEKFLLSMLQFLNGSAIDLHLPASGGNGQIVFVSTSARDAGQVQQLFQAIASLPLTGSAGMLVAVGPDVDLRGTDAVWREVAVAAADTAPALPNAGGQRLWIDATGSSQRNSAAAQRCQASEQVLTRIAQRLGGSAVEETGLRVEG